MKNRIACVLPLLAMSAILALGGCSSAPAPQGSEPQEETEATKQVSSQIGTTNEVTLDIPESWDVDTSSGYATITPDDFDGMIQVGVNISPMSALTSDEELLAEWQKTDTTVTGEWQKVSAEDDVAPMYESPAEMEAERTPEESCAW